MQREENRYSHARFKGEFILTNCTSFGLNCDTFYASFSPCFVSCIFSKFLPVSQPAPRSLRSPTSSFLSHVSLFFCLSPVLPPMSVLTVWSRVLMRRIRRPIHPVSWCYRSLETRAVSSPLFPLTATSPLHHRQADQIGTGPSNSGG